MIINLLNISFSPKGKIHVSPADTEILETYGAAVVECDLRKYHLAGLGVDVSTSPDAYIVPC